MSELVHTLLNWISSQNGIILWLFFFLSNLLENIFPPWPGDTITVFGGFLLAQNLNNSFSYLGLVSSTLAGNLAGGFLMYFFGTHFIQFLEGRDFPFKKYIYDEATLHKTLEWFSKYSTSVILFSRFSAGVRFFVSIAAGMIGVTWQAFLLYFSIANVLWCGLLISAGFLLGKNWEVILRIIDIYNYIIISLIILLLLIPFFRKYFHR